MADFADLVWDLLGDLVDANKYLCIIGLEDLLSNHIGNMRYLVPGKQRCDICHSDFFNITGHKTMAHGLLKKPSKCNGNNYASRWKLKNHKLRTAN